MKKLIIVTAAGGLAATAFSAFPAGAELTVTPYCYTVKGTTLAETPARRLFATAEKTSSGSLVAIKTCATTKREKPKTVVKFSNTSTSSRSPSSATMRASRFALVELRSRSGDAQARELRLYDLKEEKYLARYARAGAGAIVDVLTITGTFAVTDASKSVIGFDSTGARRLSGPGATEVAASARNVYWTVGGAKTGATLGSPPRGNLTDPA